MKSLVNGCAAAALLLGLASAAHAEIVVRDAPVHAVPTEDGAPAITDAADDDVAVPKAPAAVKIEAVDQAKAEPAPVKALIQPKAPPVAALTPDENAFFSVLGQRVTDAASAYESYVRRAGAIDPAFTGGASVRKAVTASAAYRPQQLDEGIVAYAALIALRNPAFVDGVRAIRDPAFADSLAASPDLVMRVPGSAEAAADAANVLRVQGAALIAAGKAVSKAAYDIQTQTWSKTPVSDPQGVLDAAKASAEQTRVATIPSKERLLASLVAAPPAPAAAGSSAPDVVRGLALAALAISGRTGDGKEAAYEALLHDASGLDCLKMAKLNLNQCLAVAGPNYEDVYCVGRHAVSDTGKCVTAAAAGGAAAPTGLPALAPPRQEQAEGYGRERAEAYGQAPIHDADDDVAQPAPRYAMEPAPRQAAPATVYAQNDYPPPQPAPYPAAAQYQPQQPSYPAQAYPAQPYPSQGYSQQPPAYAGQPYGYQPYGYAARSYYGR